MLERILRSKAEVGVLGVVLFSDGLHLREIARRANVSPPETKNELDNLSSLGLLTKTAKGNLCMYSLNPECPFSQELRGLYVKTEGAIPLLKKELNQLGGIRFAFVYGSFASNTFNEKSDVDLLIIGRARVEELDSLCLGLLKKTGREVNYILWSEEDLRKKLIEASGFINSVIRGKKIWLVGGEDEFKRIAEKARTSENRARRKNG